MTDHSDQLTTLASLTTFTHQDPKDKEITKDDSNSDDDFSSGSDNDKAKKTGNAAAEAKAAKAKKTGNAAAKAKAAKAKKTDNAAAGVKAAKTKKPDNAAAEAKAAKTKADSKKPNLLSAIRPSTSVKQGGVPVKDPTAFNKPRAVVNVTSN